MASSQTGRLGISLWSPQDPVTMEEFNRDHQILEDKLGHQAAELILESTLESASTTVVVSLEGVDWERYDHVYLDVDLPTTGGSDLWMRANGSTDTKQRMVYLYIDRSGTFQTDGALGILDSRTTNRVCLNVLGDPERFISLSYLAQNCPGWGVFLDTGFADFKNISFSVSSQSSYVISAGGTVKVWGVRR
ncbi:MAG: hypothetical protein ACOX81_03260 [Candidatus Heteroscillospira sp.]